MIRVTTAVLAACGVFMTVSVGIAAFRALLLGLIAGAFSSVAAASLGLLVTWLLFKWTCATVDELVISPTETE